jgi:hypothetical protein
VVGLGLLVAPPMFAAVDYDIVVSLDPRTHRLIGVEQVRWTNTASAPTSELQLHLYLNAFANPRTTFLRELGERVLPSAGRGSMSWGWIRIDRLETAYGDDLLPGLEFIRPDDGNPDDFTVARVPLSRAVPPGSSLTLEIGFEAQLPSLVARTGFVGDFHFVGQWFPKLGVFEDAGVRGRPEAGWNCHQFHAAGEFFADFGSFRVEVGVPDGWVVGGSGVEIQRSPASGQDRLSRVTFRADRVHDVAWCASPADLMSVVEAQFDPALHVPAPWLERTARLLQTSPADLELPPVHLRLMVPGNQLGLAERMLGAARLAMAWYGLHYGPYPYPQLTIVSPPPAARAAGGMEYPTLITTGAHHALAHAPASWLSSLESVTAHELGHQYFYGLLASNELEEAWLDEGLTSYTELNCLEAIARDGLVPAMRRSRFWPMERASLARVRFPLTIDQQAWRFRRRRDYYTATYGKAAITLRTLQGLLGDGVFARALRTYADRFRYRHPTGDDLFAVLEETSGESLMWFQEQLVRGDAIPDWAVLSVRNDHRRGGSANPGMEWSDGAWRPAPAGADDGASPGPTVEIGRRGDAIGPVEVEITFADGSRERRSWNSRERWVRWSFEGRGPVSQVVVDPDGVWALELERHDNYWRSRPGREAVHRATWWWQQLLQMTDLLRPPWS